MPHGVCPGDGQRIQDVGVNGDHEVSRLPAEALSKQLIGSLGHIGPAAVTDPNERRQDARSLAVWDFADKWFKQPQGTRSLLLAEAGDKLLQLLLGRHMFSLRGSTEYP
jgi:hypothetical protein